ncbi:MAG: transporter substrate-binding domain-containing protein [Proteobacteria bacterium]|nr:transporter substrate-binding domain-containing protein [Pseudomonadota bacterium]
MKFKILIAFVAFILTANLVYAAKTIIATGHPEYPPVMWQEGDNIVGVGPEIVKMAFGEIGITVDSKFKGSWTQVQEGIKEGAIDMMVGIYMTAQYKTFMNYSVPYMKDPVVIFVEKDKTFPYKKWDDLIGKKGTTTIGDSFGKEFDKFIAGKLTISRFLKAEDNFNKLLSAEADYFISALYSGLVEAEKLGISDKIEYLPAYATAEMFYISISKESKFIRYLPQINEKIEKLVKDGTVDKLIDEKMKYYLEGIKGKR